MIQGSAAHLRLVHGGLSADVCRVHGFALLKGNLSSGMFAMHNRGPRALVIAVGTEGALPLTTVRLLWGLTHVNGAPLRHRNEEPTMKGEYLSFSACRLDTRATSSTTTSHARRGRAIPRNKKLEVSRLVLALTDKPG